MSDEEQLFVRVPASLKYLVDEDDRTNKELVISALETELGVRSEDSVAVIDRQIKRLEDRLEDEKSAIESRRDRLRSIQRDLERARGIREQKAEEEGSYDDALDTILDDLETDGLGHIFPTHGRLDELRAEFDRPNEEIHLDLKERAAEQGRELTAAHFKQAYHVTDDDWRTPIADLWGGSDE